MPLRRFLADLDSVRQEMPVLLVQLVLVTVMAERPNAPFVREGRQSGLIGPLTIQARLTGQLPVPEEDPV